MDRRTALKIAAATAALGWGGFAAANDKFPSHGMRMVVPYPPGGVTDLAGRVVADLLSKKYGQSVVVENKPGANGLIGLQYLASTKPDGYTLALGGLGSTNATAAILNAQGNTGDVTASSTNVAYQVALNAGAPAGAAVAGSTVGVTGNSVAASAYGNSATNALTLTALNTGAPGAGAPTAAVGNYQVNSGAIVATATSVSYGIGVTGGVGGSSLRTTGNQVTANAVGNSAASSILSAR